jgi:hypothetical protein
MFTSACLSLDAFKLEGGVDDEEAARRGGVVSWSKLFATGRPGAGHKARPA